MSDISTVIVDGDEIVTTIVEAPAIITVIEAADDIIYTSVATQGLPGAGVPNGGTAGQVLAKASNLDKDTEWIDFPTDSVTSVNGETGAVVIDKSDVGLGNVDNTSDANKPVSTATATALSDKVDKITGKGLSTEDYTTAEKSKLAGIETGAQVNTVTSVNGQTGAVVIDIPVVPVTSVAGRTGAVVLTKADVGLSNVDNTSDANKPVSTAVSIELATKVDKVGGKGLSTNDYTTAEQLKLASIQPGAEVNVQANWNATSGDSFIQNKPTTMPPTVHGNEAHSVVYIDNTDSRLTNARTPTSHGNEAHTTAYVGTSDSRLTDARTPLAHKTSHLIGGSDALFPINTLDLNTGAGVPAYSEGRVYWDATNKTWAIMTSPTTTLQIGQEMIARCHNMTGSTITNGTPVKVVGANGAILIAPARADEMDAGDSIGVATQDIPDGTYGSVTAFGVVNDINTTGLSGSVWLGATGGFTSTKPAYPNAVVHIGHVVNVSATTGILFVDIIPETFQKFFDVFNLGGVYSRSQSTLAYDETTRTMSITPTGAYWAYFQNGKEYRVTTAKSAIHPATTGGHFFYIDNSGNFITTTTPWNLLTDTPLLYVYYNATISKGCAYEERHGIRDPQWHQGQHSTIGTYYVSGLAAIGYTPLSDINTALQFGIDPGIIRDEDLANTIAGQTDAGTYNVFYRTGANGEWRRDDSTMPFAFGTYAQYNQWTGTTWQLTDITNGDFYNIYVVAVPSIQSNKTIVCVPGQQKYTSLASAINATVFTDINWGTIPFVEFSVIHKFTLRAGSSFTSTGKVRIENYTDLRGTTRSTQITGGGAVTHNGLAGLNTGDYLHLTAAEYAAMLPEAPIDGKQYARKNGAWVEVVGGGGGTLATATGTLAFGTGNTTAQVSVSYPAITADTVISIIEFTNKLEEVLIQDMKIKEINRTVGVGFTVMGFAPDKAAGDYQFRAIIQE